MQFMKVLFLFLLIIFLPIISFLQNLKFNNPIAYQRADLWVIKTEDGIYYLMQQFQNIMNRNYKGNCYFIYHNGGIQTDGESNSRSICIDKLEFDENRFYKSVKKTT